MLEDVTQQGDSVFLASAMGAKATLSNLLSLVHKHGTYDDASKFWSDSAKKNEDPKEIFKNIGRSFFSKTKFLK